MKSFNKTEILTGSLVGAILTMVLLACFFIAWRMAGLPFVPFDLFDWTNRLLPGALVEFVIGIMVATIRLLHLGPTSVVAKEIEQAMGIAGLFITGILGGAIVFGLANIFRGRFAYHLGLLLGITIGIPAVIASSTISKTASVAPTAGAFWVSLLFLLWGIGFGWTYRRMWTDSSISSTTAHQGSVSRVSRRQFLIKLAGSCATITVIGAVVGALSEPQRRRRLIPAIQRWSANHKLPNADAAINPVPGTRAEYTPLEQHYRIDINTTPPNIDEQRWRVKIGWLVEAPLAMTLEQLKSYEPMDQFITLSCISNPVGGDLIGTTRWTGISLQHLLPILRIKPNATHLKISSADGFYEVVPLETIKSDNRVMLTYEWDGVPLLPEHGFPLRIYIPNIYGMKQPKWIESIEAVENWEPGYWVVRGWDRIARMKATSVIDTVKVDANRRVVSIGGIAHAGVRGISKVEVQIDDGGWQPAVLRSPISQKTWVIWRYDWLFVPGKHTFKVRCYDGTGAVQIATASPPAPSGATGIFSETKRI